MDQRMLEYNALDAACTLEIHSHLWPELLSRGYERTYWLNTQHMESLIFMMTRGIRVDREGLVASRTDVRAREEAAREELNILAGRVLDPLSSKDCQLYFYIEKGITPYYNRTTGKPTVDDLTLQRLARGTSTRMGLKEAKTIQTIRGLGKLASTYLEVETDNDGRLRCSYNPRGTRFGRLSSSSTIYDTGTNLQNLPPEFKRFCLPDEGYFFVEVDKRQAEWVVVAYLSGDANMLSVIEREADPHTHTASLMFRVPADIIGLDSKTCGSSTDRDYLLEMRNEVADLRPFIHLLPGSMSGRQAGKKSNHGLNYDEGYTTFSLTNEILESEGRRMVELYHSIYPNIRNFWYPKIKNKLAKDRTLENCLGRKYYFMLETGDKLWKAAYAFQPQSTVVDSLDIGMQEVYNDEEICGPSGCNADLLAQVHDSILLQFPLSVLRNSHQFHGAMRSIFSSVSPELEYNARKFKIATDAKVGLNWGGYHSEHNPAGMQEVKLGEDAEVFADKVRSIVNGSGAGGLA